MFAVAPVAHASRPRYAWSLGFVVELKDLAPAAVVAASLACGLRLSSAVVADSGGVDYTEPRLHRWLRQAEG